MWERIKNEALGDNLQYVSEREFPRVGYAWVSTFREDAGYRVVICVGEGTRTMFAPDLNSAMYGVQMADCGAGFPGEWSADNDTE